MPLASKPVVCIVTPGTRSANNGNWRTAARWAAMLRDRFRIIVQTQWDGMAADAMVALHARRSAASIERFARERPAAPLVVVLTGTDLYRDLPESREAAASLDRASRIVVLQEDAPRLLPAKWKRRAEVIFQSAEPMAAAPKPRDRLDVVMVGHLRAEKDPRTLFAAVRELPEGLPIRIRHIGAPLDRALGDEARALQERDSRYRYLGARARGATRAAMRAAHVLVHPSVIEGGANVIVEAIMAGTPVIASRISGNVGMLGRGYPGLFPAGNAKALAKLIERACEDPRFLATLRKACNARRSLFRPAAERRALHRLLARALRPGR